MFKFSLKALLILVSLFSIGLGIWFNGYQTALRETYLKTPKAGSSPLPSNQIVEISKGIEK